MRFRSDTHGGEWGNIDPGGYQKDVTNSSYNMAERTYCWHDLKLHNPRQAEEEEEEEGGGEINRETKHSQQFGINPLICINLL